jgi:hypothetical protein
MGREARMLIEFINSKCRVIVGVMLDDIKILVQCIVKPLRRTVSINFEDIINIETHIMEV